LNPDIFFHNKSEKRVLPDTALPLRSSSGSVTKTEIVPSSAAEIVDEEKRSKERFCQGLKQKSKKDFGAKCETLQKGSENQNLGEKKKGKPSKTSGEAKEGSNKNDQ
jgi:hypothetical protein